MLRSVGAWYRLGGCHDNQKGLGIAKVHELYEPYIRLVARYKPPTEGAIDANRLLAFDYEYPSRTLRW